MGEDHLFCNSEIVIMTCKSGPPHGAAFVSVQATISAVLSIDDASVHVPSVKSIAHIFGFTSLIDFSTALRIHMPLPIITINNSVCMEFWSQELCWGSKQPKRKGHELV